MKKTLASIALVALLLVCLYLLSIATKNQGVLVVIIIACITVLVKMRKKKKKNEKKVENVPMPKSPSERTNIPETASPAVKNQKPIVNIEVTSAPRRNSRKFTIVGVTFQGRQTYLRKISEYEEPFVGCMFDVNKTEFEGETAFEVVALLDDGKEKVLGHIGKRDIAKVEEIYGSITSVDVEVYGGPEYDEDDKNYGASVELFFD